MYTIFRRLIRTVSNNTMGGKYKIVMVRHGESEWNQKNQFCGWFDADLSEKGDYYIKDSASHFYKELCTVEQVPLWWLSNAAYT